MIEWKPYRSPGSAADYPVGWVAGRPLYAIMHAPDRYQLFLFGYDGDLVLLNIRGDQLADPIDQLKAEAEKHHARLTRVT